MLKFFIDAMEKGHLPDKAIRLGIRRLCHQRLMALSVDSLEAKILREQNYKHDLINSLPAIHTSAANEQHYEVVSDFFVHVLGSHLKYSSCYWDESTKSLSDAERKALAIYVERAEIKDGMRVLELGCGWGSLTLYMAAAFPRSKFVAISNSSSQREFIQAQLEKRGLKNVLVLTRDISQLETLALEFESFDRVVSVEMLEHFKNYQDIFKKIADVLTPDGKFFTHIFTHREYSYPFETEGEDNWMGKYFFTGGQMPSHYLFYEFQRDLVLGRSWAWDGTHYQKTSDAWLENMDTKKELILPILQSVYKQDYQLWFQRWRVFFMACSELFGYQGGSQWGVSHYLFSKRG